jgi:hypothetical protein
LAGGGGGPHNDAYLLALVEIGDRVGHGGRGVASHPDWIPKKLLIPLVQSGVEKERELPDVPLITELPAKSEDKPLLQFMARASTVGRPLATTPGVPAERVAALRAAFTAMVKDPEFIAAAAREKLEIQPQTGEQLQEIIYGLLDSPPDATSRTSS